MTVVASAWPAGTDRGQPSGHLRRDGRWDRRVALLDSEAAALLALGPVGLRRNRAVGIPRRTAPHWHALTRLIEPLDAAVAGLHHGEHVRFRRAGAHAAAVVLQHCADTGRSWWGWTPWEWARLCGGSAGEFVDRAAVADRVDGAAVRGGSGLPARRVHRLPPAGHVQSTSPGLLDLW